MMTVSYVIVCRLLNRQNMSATGLSTSRHPQSVGGAASLSDLHHPHLPHQRCHGDDDDDDLLLSDSDDFSDHRPTRAAAGGSGTPGGDPDETGSLRGGRSPDIDEDIDDDDAEALIDPAASPTISVGVSSRSSSPDPPRPQRPAVPLDSADSGGPVPTTSTTSAAGSADHHHPHHHPRLHQQLHPTFGLGLGVTATALAGLYHHQLHHQHRPPPPHHLGPPLIPPPGLPFPPGPGFPPFQPSLYPFSPLLSFAVTSPGPNR